MLLQTLFYTFMTVFLSVAFQPLASEWQIPENLEMQILWPLLN